MDLLIIRESLSSRYPNRLQCLKLLHIVWIILLQIY